MHRVLRVPKRELEVHFPVRFDDGHVEAFTGYRVHHNVNRGPATGGVRYTKDLTLDLVRANAMWNTWKTALVEIPYGGAFGGVVVNPRRLGSAHSPAISTDPLHAPPTPRPCSTRPQVSSTAPQIPIVSYDGTRPIPTVAAPISIIVVMRSALRPTRSP